MTSENWLRTGKSAVDSIKFIRKTQHLSNRTIGKTVMNLKNEIREDISDLTNYSFEMQKLVT